MAKFNPKKVEISMHAEERAVERLGIPKHQAKLHIRQLLQNAKEVQHTKRGITFEHKKSQTLIILNRSKSVVMTVYKMNPEPVATQHIKPVVTDDRLVKALQDEYMGSEYELKHTIFSAKIAEHTLQMKLYKTRIKLLDAKEKKRNKLLEKEDSLVGEIKVVQQLAEDSNRKLALIESQYKSAIGE